MENKQTIDPGVAEALKEEFGEDVLDNMELLDDIFHTPEDLDDIE